MDALTERVNLLRGVRFFAGAPEAALPMVAAALEPLSLEPGQALFHKGDVGDSMYVITSGRLRVHDNAMLINDLGPGEVVGEMAVLDAQPRSASVTALEASELLCLRQELLYELIAIHPSVALGVIGTLSKHLRNRVIDRAQDQAFIGQVHMIARAAEAINAGTYQRESIDEVARRDDALGQLARTFQHMAAEVIAREHKLRREVQRLRIEIDQNRQQHQVTEITTSDYFRGLQERAAALRATFGEDADEVEEAPGA